MNKCIALALAFILACSIIAEAQRPTGQVVSGATSSGTPVTIQTDANGVVSVQGISGGTPSTSQITPNVTYPTAYGLALTNLLTTSGTVATAGTVLLGTLTCINASTSAAVAVNATNTAGSPLQGVGFSIPASSDKIMNFYSGLLAVGVKWWASTTTAWCSITGWQ